MKTEILNAPVEAPKPRFPALYRHKTTGIVWWSLSPSACVCLVPARDGSCYQAGDLLSGPQHEPWEPENWERLIGPVDIRFIP